MSVPASPDPTAQDKYTLMLLERVDALTEELHAVKEGLADARTRLAVAEKRLADARAQLVVPGRNVCIEEGGGLHASQWFMYVLSVEPLTAAGVRQLDREGQRHRRRDLRGSHAHRGKNEHQSRQPRTDRGCAVRPSRHDRVAKGCFRPRQRNAVHSLGLGQT